MSNDVCFLGRVQITPGKSCCYLVTQLRSSEFNTSCRIKLQRYHTAVFEDFRNAAKILDSEYFVKAENAMHQNNVHLSNTVCPQFQRFASIAPDLNGCRGFQR